MAARIGQVDAVSGAPSYVGRALRQLFSVFLGGATAARPLGAISGVRPGTPSSIVTATSTTWTVTPFAGVIDLHTAAIAGPYEFAFDANVTGSVTAASGSFARVDILYVRASDPSESDGSSVPAIEVLYLAGTVAGTPPATPARSFRIARINVPISGGGSPTVTWDAPYTVAAGGVLPIATKALLDLVPGSDGMQAYVTSDTTASNIGLYTWSTTWKKLAVVPLNLSVSNAGLWTADNPAIVVENGWCTVSLRSGRASALFAANTNEVIATLPVGARPASVVPGAGAVSGGASPQPVYVQVEADGSVRVFNGSVASVFAAVNLRFKI